MSRSKIILNSVNFHLANTNVSFKHLNLSFDDKLTGLIGDNGVGKSTFLKLLNGSYSADSGIINCLGKIFTVDQLSEKQMDQKNVAEALNINETLHSLRALSRGDYTPLDLERCEGYWDLECRLEDLFNRFNLSVSFEQPYCSLSGGEQTKVRLMKPLLYNADFLLLDEPTNNLDEESRNIIYQYLSELKIGALVCSHDRALLDLMEQTLELSTLGFKLYGGNYLFYKHQKEIEQKALEDSLSQKMLKLKKREQSIQNRYEKHQRNEAKGVRAKKSEIQAKGRYDKLAFNSQKGRSEKTNKRIRTQATKMLSEVSSELKRVKEKVEIKHEMNVCLTESCLSRKKQVLLVENLNFAYSNKKALFNDLTFSIHGPERVAICGKNGSGKSTLLKLILGELEPLGGKAVLGVGKVVYLDQQLLFLDPEKSLVENYLTINLKSTVHDAHNALAAFNFRNDEALKLFKTLSGGERIRAALAIRLLTNPAPELVILDEPTNHLDLCSIEVIEQALCNYRGAILVISHDESFLKNIKIERKIMLD